MQGNLVMLELGDRVKAKGVLHAQSKEQWAAIVIADTSHASSPAADLEVGSNVTVCILDVDVSDSSLVVSLNPRLVEAGSAKKSVKGNKKKLQHSVVMERRPPVCDLVWLLPL